MTGRIFITGDKHGAMFLISRFAECNHIHENDILIIDTEYVWNEDYKYSIETLQQIFPGIIAFIDGNHDNHVLLNQFEVTLWNRGNVHKIGERVYHLMRGELYSIYGNNIFVFGGARSNDKDRRQAGISWWEEEEPSFTEISYGLKKLSVHGENIDYIITHESPLSARKYISRKKEIAPDYHLPAIFDVWYKKIKNNPRFKKWYFGHMHVNQVIEPTLHAIYSDIIQMGDSLYHNED